MRIKKFLPFLDGGAAVRGMTAAAPAARAATPTYQFTIVSVADTLNAVQAKLTPEALVDMNVQNTVDKKSAADIAKAFLADNGLK